ncbi:Homeobox protein knotted-1-like 3 [Cocos nucifera]|uniref:Homeobox protein knotted-1-like 3 n=1 Tax=Cocos nucifera TaxID=13894 RepID=A0A8K0HTW9_COCNU|nr:Homeobox protein knotted-1-like 3 [Cocos nucifera]
MALPPYAEQQLGESPVVLRTMAAGSHEAVGKVSGGGGGGPSWLSSAVLRQQSQPYGVDGSFLHLQTASDSSASQAVVSQWLPRPQMRGADEENPVSGESMIAAVMSHGGRGGGGGGGGSGGQGDGAAEAAAVGDGAWQNARYKAEILAHPLYEQLLAAHVACLRIATPVDQLPRIDAQLGQSQHVVAKYSVLGAAANPDDKELNQFMVGNRGPGSKKLLQVSPFGFLGSQLRSKAPKFVFLFLEGYVKLNVTWGMNPCCSFGVMFLGQKSGTKKGSFVTGAPWIPNRLVHSPGVSPGEGTGATMSDDDDDQADSDTNLFDESLDGPDSMGFGPLLPTESERSLMERVRQELKTELKQGYKNKIVDIREEILRKRRAGKLPGGTTSLLKSWWQSHSKWPYPTEDDKAQLVQETGLQLKQINNWFINQRKRNWHSNPSSTTALKSKRKR